MLNKLKENTGIKNQENSNIDLNKRDFLKLSVTAFLSSALNSFGDDIGNVVNPDKNEKIDNQKKELETTDSFGKGIEKYFDINEGDLEKFLNGEIGLTAKDNMVSETLLSLMPEKVGSLKIEGTTGYRGVFRKCDGFFDGVKRKGFYLIGQRGIPKKYGIKKGTKIFFFQDNKSVESEDESLKPRKQVSKEFYPRSYEELTDKELYSIILEKDKEGRYAFLSKNLRAYDALGFPRFNLELIAELFEHVIKPHKGDLVLSSGRRPEDENDAKGGVENSSHLSALAFDIFSQYSAKREELYNRVRAYLKNMNYEDYFGIEDIIQHGNPPHLHLEFYPRLKEDGSIGESLSDKIIRKKDTDLYKNALKKYREFFGKKYHFDKFYKKHFMNGDVSKLGDFIEDLRMKKGLLFGYSLDKHYQYLINKYEGLKDYLSMSDLRVISELDGIDTDKEFLSVVSLHKNVM